MKVIWMLCFFASFSWTAGCETKTKAVDRCGDGFLDPGEDCDGKELGGHTCLSLGHYVDGPLSCRSNCRFNTSGCGGHCGDGILEKANGEDCDLYDLDGKDCESLGFSGGSLGCGTDCRFNTGSCHSVCGDGVVEPDEACDDGNREDGDGCDSYCRVEPGHFCEGSPSVCDAVCGDRMIVGDEACDGTTLGGGTCQVLGYYGGALGCSPDCMGFDETDCVRYGRCGDGVLQGPHGEECDGTDLGAASCWSLGYSMAGGGLSCTEYCRFDTGQCFPRRSNADLATLTVSAGVMVPPFSPERLSYALTVPVTQSTVTVFATTADSLATAVFVPAQPMMLAVGENPVMVTVTAEDGTQKLYTVAVHRTNDILSPNLGMLRHVPAGTFQRDSGPANLSTVSAFRMGPTEITRAQWMAVTGWIDPGNLLYSSGVDDPVQQVNFYDAIAFCNRLSLLEGLEPVYSVDGVHFETLAFEDIPQANSATWNAVTVNWSANGYRLPTEMEWMWAAMGADTASPGSVNTTGWTKAFAGSDGTNAIGDYAVFGYPGTQEGRTSSERTNPVGSRLANELGLYDMSGNVVEWIWDRYAVFPSGPLTDYRGADSGSGRQWRGGSWKDPSDHCAVSSRQYSMFVWRYHYAGFRVVRP